MLRLDNIHKQYISGDTKVEALKGVSLAFRRSEFVSILGPSGCGKTTLLNIIGGLDRYDEGNLSIDGKSTREFRDGDWDAYRNHSVGFVFQTYNLIPHQSVLSNVELALTLSGVSKAERRRRAVAVLERVGLGDQLRKRPNQLSGGQMQRVAIARALVNDPEILLADEPTGALDSGTSVQIMEILKEIAQDRLVIMVTHNPELAGRYSTRIIRLLDGRVTDDSMPFEEAPWAQEARAKAQKRPSMSFRTALSLSLNNLMTKKGRTLMVALAGSIGIIGIALILSLSTGLQAYIDGVEENTLGAYPLSITSETIDAGNLLTSMMGAGGGEDDAPREADRVYTSTIMYDMINAMLSEITTNNLEAFKAYMDADSRFAENTTSIQYGYGVTLNLYNMEGVNGVTQVNPSTVMENMTGTSMYADMTSAQSGSAFASMASASGMGMGAGGMNVWRELPGGEAVMETQYEVLGGRLPAAYDEAVLIVGRNNQISDMTLYALGLKDQRELPSLLQKVMRGETLETEETSFSFDELLSLRFRLLLPAQCYEPDGQGGWVDKSQDEAFLAALLEDAPEIRIVGIVRPVEDALVTTGEYGMIGYTAALTEYAVEQTAQCAIVQQQLASPQTDVFTGLPFALDDEGDYTLEMLPEDRQAYLSIFSEAELDALMQTYAAQGVSDATYAQNLARLGVADLDKPASISLYPRDFEAKDALVALIAEYNQAAMDEGREGDVINYTDYVGLMMSSVSTIINAITYVLIAFVAISLVVSSIMIGIITYISVLERTKEIGILRSIGASKRDISRVFNAETLIIGFCAGLLGILVTWVLTFPANVVVDRLTGIARAAILPGAGAAILVAISMALTLVAGLIPSRIAARKDPVVALRTE